MQASNTANHAPAAAYVIVETDIHDPEQYKHYKAAAAAAIVACGGRFVVRGGEFAVLEGDWTPARLVVLEFPDLEMAKRWYASPQYQAASRLRDGAATLRMVAVQGVDQQETAPYQQREFSHRMSRRFAGIRRGSAAAWGLRLVRSITA
ncbi:DUF1330 domain-containing protein [Mycobacterium sp. 1274761.0]|uniref:DUF1330 domain-containing protein n=1 Tax=Mycobacterium sp. 1274761.0 TaxID=1834077 RepID=UPI0007FDBCB8|nr:DUF1330 domain-containing protein [Mycobacterium sp. 1274761.0]OBK72206.1 hypothetical protein A5651_16865 [Mycobacterium sp. 1274761.0]